MNITESFELERYGLHLRMVRMEDAEFIIRLRTDPKLGHYLHATSNDISKQKEWLAVYKKREKRGEDYYFVFETPKGNPIGVIRIYNIDYIAKKATAGSWVCAQNLPIQIPISVLIICREIMFDMLGMEKDCFDVRKTNKQVLRLHKMMGAEMVAEDELNYFFELPKEVFEEKKHEIINLLNIE